MDMSLQFPVWKTIDLGTYKNVEEISAAITNLGYRIGSWADDVLHSAAFTIASEVTSVDLVKITPLDLGFTEGAYRTDIYKRALERGLVLCPLEVGPQLRIQYHGQPRMESLQIAMEPQCDRENHESEFRVVHGGDNFIWLVGDHRHPDDFWKADEPFIFVRK